MARISTIMWKSVPNFVEICVITMPQRDLKGLMPEQSEWLLAEGAAKRNPRYRDALFDAKNANITFPGGNICSYNALAPVYPASAYQKRKGASQ